MRSKNVVAKAKPFALVQREIAAVRNHITAMVRKSDNVVLDHAGKYVLEGEGKLLRPALVALMAHACLPPEVSAAIQEVPIPSLDYMHVTANAHDIRRYLRLAEVTELIHTASLVHDDVIDDSSTRRGRPALHTEIGTKKAVLAGDFLLARASYWIATLDTPEIVLRMTEALENLTAGELLQLDGCFDIPSYLNKSYCKTASLIDKSLSSTAVLAGNRTYVDPAGSYGQHLGIAFQIVDDCLDVTGTEDNLGKPKLSDMKEGIATLPCLLAAKREPLVDAIVRRRFANPGDPELALERVLALGTVAEALQMADKHCEMAVAALGALHPSPARDALGQVVHVVLTRQS